MKPVDIQHANVLAERFLDLADARLTEMECDHGIHRTKLSGALRRASMDLTRALTEMRKT